VVTPSTLGVLPKTSSGKLQRAKTRELYDLAVELHESELSAKSPFPSETSLHRAPTVRHAVERSYFKLPA
jgi:hypothetical protein